MTAERLSKLQKWILTNWSNPEYPINEHMNGGQNPEDYHNTFWIYQYFFKIKSGISTFTEYGKDKYGVYKIENKYSVVVYRSLMNMVKKGLIEVKYRGRRGRGHLIFNLTDKSKNILIINQEGKFASLLNIKKEQQLEKT